MACVFVEVTNQKPWNLKDISNANVSTGLKNLNVFEQCDIESGEESGQFHQVQCDVCHNNFEDTTQLDEHRKIHFSVIVHSCPDCKDKFLSKSSLEKHQQVVHQSGQPINEEKSASVIVEDRPKIVIKCQYCKESYQINNPQEFKSHERKCKVVQMKVDVKPLTIFKVKTPSRTHLESSGNRLFSCNICQKSFSSKYFLNSHALVHSSSAVKAHSNTAVRMVVNQRKY